MLRTLRIISFVLGILQVLDLSLFCANPDATDIAIYGLTEEGKIYYRKGSDWALLDGNTRWAHIAAGPNGQLYCITHVIYKSEEDNKDNNYPTPADIEKWPTLLDGGDVSVRTGVTAENPMGSGWVQIPSRRLTYGRLDHFIGIAAGKDKIIGCTAPKYRDILIRSNPLRGDVHANAASPWQETKGTAYDVAMDPVNGTMFIIDDWQRYSGGNTYSSVIGHIYKRNASDTSGWDNISPWCIGSISKDNMNSSDQYVGEEGWGKTLHVCATRSNIIQIAAGNNTLFCVGKDGALFANTNPNDDNYTALDPAPIRLPALYTMTSQSRPFIAAGVKSNGANEVWLVQRQTIQYVQQNQLYHEAETTQTASQGFVAGRTLETASFIFRRQGTELGNQTGFGWEQVYSSLDAKPDQKFVFKEIAVGSLKTP